LTARALGVAASVDGKTIVIDTATNTVKVSSISAANISLSAVRAANLHSDVAVASGGIVYTLSGLSAGIDNNTIKMYSGKMGVDASALGIQVVPAGTIIHTACSTAPTGYLACSGQRVLISSYTALATAIYVGDLNNTNESIQYGQKWDAETGGSRSSSGTYISLPNLQGVFMRGWNPTSSGYDASRTFGSLQLDAFKAHSHTYTVVAANRSAHAAYNTQSMFSAGLTNTGVTGDVETRPVNLPFLACIKT
jgi:hypothetical protein